MIKNTLPEKSGNPESHKKKSRQFESSLTNMPMVGKDLLRAFYRLYYLQFSDSNDQKKHYIAKVLLAIREIFLYENNRNYISYRCNYKFALIHFLSFLTNQEQESGFHQVGSLVARNIPALCL